MKRDIRSRGRTVVAGAIVTVAGVALAFRAGKAQEALRTPAFLNRTYSTGDVLHYEMKGSNQGWEYQVRATDVVKRDDEGVFYEEIGWSDLHSNAPMTLSPASLAFRQTVSTDAKGKYLAVPDLSTVQPFLIGPITDTLTFYADLLTAKRAQLTQVGQHGYVEHGKPNSWADGERVLLGEDSIDFDVALVERNAQEHTVMLLIRHVVPKQPQVRLPAEWMRVPVAGTPNNWVQVEKKGNNYVAGVGQEKFDVRMTLDERDGKILGVELHNPLVTVERTCDDAALVQCGQAATRTSSREVSFWLVQ